MLRRAMAKEHMIPVAAPQPGISMTEPQKLKWRPGDPFAGKVTPRARRFRVHAMLLTASTVAGVGYLAILAMRMLLATGTISG